MNKIFRMFVTDYHKFSNGQTCLIGIAEPKEHKVITSDCTAKIIVESFGEFPLNILGQDIISRSAKTNENEKTMLRTEDDVEQILQYIGKKQVTIVGRYPDPGKDVQL